MGLSGVENSKTTMCPPGRTTRIISLSPCARSPKLRTPKATVTASTLLSGRLILSAMPQWSSTLPVSCSSATLRRATASIPSDRSMPMTLAEGMRWERAMAKSPVPVARSRMVCGENFSTIFTTRRRQILSIWIDKMWFRRSYSGAMLSNISFTSSLLVDSSRLYGFINYLYFTISSGVMVATIRVGRIITNNTTDMTPTLSAATHHKRSSMGTSESM